MGCHYKRGCTYGQPDGPDDIIKDCDCTVVVYCDNCSAIMTKLLPTGYCESCWRPMTNQCNNGNCDTLPVVEWHICEKCPKDEYD